MDKAANIVKTMTKKKDKKSSKSTKDKTRNPPGQDISGPKGGTDGLYIKLVQHQRSIGVQMQMINSAVNNGTTVNLSQVTTVLLIQIDSAITTTHHFLTSEVLEKFDGVKTRMDACERILYVNVAKVVKWADFDSKSPPMSTTASGKLVRNWIQEFETALGELVKLVEETQMQLSGSSGTFSDTVRRQRRSSLGSSNSTGALGPLEPAPLPQISTLKGEGGGRDRKISLPIVSTQPIARGLPASMGKPPTGRESLGSMLSESSTSDEEKRRSGSTDRVSPDRHDLTMSGEWNGRNRSQTESFAPPHVPIPVPRHPHPISSPSHTLTSSLTAPPSGALTDMDRSLLPPLPGEPHATGWRMAPGYPHDRRGHTMPRGASESPKVNGRWSPEPRLPGHHGSTLGHNDDMPPPLPVKQKRRMNQQVNGLPPRPPIRRENYDDVPPPLPMKQRKGVGTTSPPTTTPGPSPSHSSSSEGDRPPMVPVRLDSIIPRGALHNEAVPPKPPRTDRPASMDQQPTSNEVESAIRAVRRYNEDLMKGQAETGGEEKAPPIPLKKKTVMLYKEIVKGYHFDDTLMQPLYIPMAETGPPALPPKKRKSRRQVPSVGRMRDEHSGGSGVDKRSSSDDQRSSVASSVEDLADDTDAEDINYLELEDTSGSLIFHKEADGGYTLRGGPLDALIAYAASTTSAVKQFTEAFLLTYYTFITPEGLISKLLSRLDYFYKQRNKPVWTATTSLLVRLLNNLNQPLVQEAEVRLIEMVHQMLSDGNLKFAQLLRNALVTKLNQLIPVNTKTAPLVGPGFKSNRKFAVTDFSPEEIARQMTVLDNELFQKVDVSEMLYWAKEQNEEKSPMLTHFTMHFNNVSQWTKTRILERGVDMRVRVKVVLHFVGIMKALRDIFNNFNSYLAILSAIESSPVSRLDWPDRVTKSLEEPRALIDNKGSFKNYREAFARAKPPCIPYIGLYLQDLTFIEMQPKLLEDGVSVNFTKRWKQFKSVDHIRFAQTKQYNFDPNPDILSLFSNFEDFASDEELWAFSNEVKPSARVQWAQLSS